jgi:hypothetical protein
LVDRVRHAVNTKDHPSDTEIQIWAGFRDAQRAPEHMWIVFNGRIFETAPACPIESAPLTLENATYPPFEQQPETGADFGPTGAVTETET